MTLIINIKNILLHARCCSTEVIWILMTVIDWIANMSWIIDLTRHIWISIEAGTYHWGGNHFSWGWENIVFNIFLVWYWYQSGDNKVKQVLRDEKSFLNLRYISVWWFLTQILLNKLVICFIPDMREICQDGSISKAVNWMTFLFNCLNKVSCYHQLVYLKDMLGKCRINSSFMITIELKLFWDSVNPLWSSDIVGHQRSTSVQVIFGCLMEPSHYLNQRWLIINWTLNSLRPSDAYMCQWTRPPLLQIMACRLAGAKPLSEPMLEYC